MKSFLSAVDRPRSEPIAYEPTADDIARIFQSETGEIRTLAGPVRSRRAVLLLAAMLVSLVAIIGSFKLDRVVTSIFGQIVTIEPTTVLQPFDLSIIKSINVREGERVKKGQLVATLDPTIAASSVDALRLQIASLDPEIARCEAELARRPFVYVPGHGSGEARYAALQHGYYLQRKAQYDAQLRSYDAQIAQYQATIKELANDAQRYDDRTRLNQQIQNMQAGLLHSPAFSKLLLLQATDQTTELRRQMQADQNNIPVTEQQLRSTQAMRAAYIEQWRAQTNQELVTARNQRDTAEQQLQAALKHLDEVRLYAPDDAVVLRLAKLSVGSVLQPGDDFIELASLHSPVEAEIYIDPMNIGFVRPGDSVTLKLDPYNFVEYGWAEGKVRWISPGTYTTPTSGTGGTVAQGGTSPGTGAIPQNPDTGNQPGSSSSNITTPFYIARVEITKIKLKNVPKDAHLMPGATLTADIHVGTQSVFYYIFSGVVRSFDQAMREP
jgi:membrane fusion protein, hemolysin D